MILKKNLKARLRIVHDYRELNANTILDYYLLLIQEDITRLIAHAKIRSKLDFSIAYV
jgi:hypothetical protein